MTALPLPSSRVPVPSDRAQADAAAPGAAEADHPDTGGGLRGLHQGLSGPSRYPPTGRGPQELYNPASHFSIPNPRPAPGWLPPRPYGRRRSGGYSSPPRGKTLWELNYWKIIPIFFRTWRSFLAGSHCQSPWKCDGVLSKKHLLLCAKKRGAHSSPLWPAVVESAWRVRSNDPRVVRAGGILACSAMPVNGETGTNGKAAGPARGPPRRNFWNLSQSANSGVER